MTATSPPSRADQDDQPGRPHETIPRERPGGHATNETRSSPGHPPTGGTLSWTSHPARERPDRAAMGAIIIAALAITAGLTTGSIGWAAFTVVVLFLSVCRFYLPTRYRFDEEGVSASHAIAPRRVSWSAVRRVGFDERGGFLGRRARRAWLDGFTGLHLLFPPDMTAQEREAIRQFARAHANQPSPRREPPTA